MTVDKRFALIDSDGHRRYPYLSQNARGTYGFVLGRSKNARHTTQIEEAIREVVLNGVSMRVKALEGPHANQGNSLNLHAGRKIVGFYVAPELVHLVEGAAFDNLRVAGEHVAESPATEAERLNRLRVQDVVTVLYDLRDALTPELREMLEVHAAATDYRSSLKELACAVDGARTDELEAAYLTLARALGTGLGLRSPSGLEALAFGNDSRSDGVWVLRPQVVAALKETGFIEFATEPEQASNLETDPQFRAASPTVRRALMNARVGQGGYRKRMMSLWGRRCAVTGCPIEAVLVASHAKAWKCSTNQERLDEYNGLLLSGSLDRLFDAGLVAFEDNGSLLRSPLLSDEDLHILGIETNCRLRFVLPRHRPYLAAHRAQHGFI